MELYRINTTAYEEEDFFLLTALSEQDITDVIEPIVLSERKGDIEEQNDNESLYRALRDRYPSKKIIMLSDAQTLSY